MKIRELLTEEDDDVMKALMKRGRAAMKRIPSMEFGAVKAFDKWVSRNDLWHPDFPEQFDKCASKFLKGDYDLQQIGNHFADHARSFYGEDMVKFIEYAKKNPPPEEEEKLEAYVVKAWNDMNDV